MLARTAAAEVIARQQDLAGLRFRLVQDEVRLRLPVGFVTPIAEKLIAQPDLRNGLQESRGDNLIGVDVVARDQYHSAFKRRELFHYSNSLTSLTMPEIADA